MTITWPKTATFYGSEAAGATAAGVHLAKRQEEV